MDARDYLRIAPFLNDCPQCGSDKIGEEQGTMEVKEGRFIERTCQCGFQLTYDVTNGTTKKKIKEAVDQALKQIKSINE